MSKNKLMTNSIKKRLNMGGEEILYVQDYLYLSVLNSQARHDKEVARRNESAWRSNWSMKDLFKGDLPLCLKRTCIGIHTFTHGAQTC